MLMILATACSNQTKKTATKSDTEQEQTTYYQDLSKSDRENLDFTFKAVEDDSTSSSDTSYIIDMTMKNNSTKDIKLILSKFFMLNPYDEDAKVTSSKKDTVTLKAGQKKTVKQIFENVSKDVIDGQGAYYYLNKSYRLAYIYNSTSDKGAKLNNLKDSAAKKFNKKQAEDSDEPSTTDESTTTDTSTETDNSSQQSNTQNSSASANIINTPNQAIGLFKHMWGIEARDDIVADPVSGGFYVHSTSGQEADSYLAATIHYDGSAEYSDGTQDSYSTISQPLNTDISDGKPFNPANY